MSNQILLTAIAFRIKELRTIRNLSQEEFGYILGLDRTHICKIENARMDIKISTLYKICAKANLSLKDFFDSPYFEQDLNEVSTDELD